MAMKFHRAIFDLHQKNLKNPLLNIMYKNMEAMMKLYQNC
jgi:hypothetical protein